MTNKRNSAQDNAEKAVMRLEQSLTVSVRDEREQAGVNQAFEFTFETCWKLLQKVAVAEGLETPSPKSAISAGFHLGICEPEEA